MHMHVGNGLERWVLCAPRQRGQAGTRLRTELAATTASRPPGRQASACDSRAATLAGEASCPPLPEHGAVPIAPSAQKSKAHAAPRGDLPTSPLLPGRPHLRSQRCGTLSQPLRHAAQRAVRACDARQQVVGELVFALHAWPPVCVRGWWWLGGGRRRHMGGHRHCCYGTLWQAVQRLPATGSLFRMATMCTVRVC